MEEIIVEFRGPMRRPCRERQLSMPLPPGGRVEDVLSSVGYGSDERGRLVVTSKGRVLGLGDRVEPGDHLILLLPIGGG